MTGRAGHSEPDAAVEPAGAAMLPGRRALLKNGFGLIVAAIGFGAVSAACTDDGAAGGADLRLVGSKWHMNVFKPGEAPAQASSLFPVRGDTIVMWGELEDGDGERLGEFYSSASCVFAPISDEPAANLEFHAFRLKKGSVMGMGTVPAAPSAPVQFAVIGGTGDYAGARGTYVAEQRPFELGGDGTAAFTMKLG